MNSHTKASMNTLLSAGSRLSATSPHLRRGLLVLPGLAAALLAGIPAQAQDRTSDIDRIFSWATPKTPGCVVGVSRNGRVVANRAHGSANLERNIRLSPATVAQERGSRGAAVGYFGMGVSHIATGELDERLAARGYPSFGRTAAAVGIGAYLILEGGAMLGGEWTGLIMGDDEHEGRKVGLGGGYGTLGLGYAVDLSPRVRVYPRLGLGGGGMGLWIESSADAVDFDEVLANPDRHSERADSTRQTVLSRGSALLDLGAGADFLPGGWGRGLVIGVRLGYLAAPSGSGWGLYERDARGGPAATFTGPYLRVVLGGGPRW